MGNGVRFVDPRAESAVPVEAYDRFVDLEARPMVVGLVANGFPDSEPFLDHLEQAMKHALPEITVRRWNKGNASAIIPDAMLDEVVAECDAAIGAYGH